MIHMGNNGGVGEQKTILVATGSLIGKSVSSSYLIPFSLALVRPYQSVELLLASTALLHRLLALSQSFSL